MNTTVTVLKEEQEEPRGEEQDADEDREQDLEKVGACALGLDWGWCSRTTGAPNSSLLLPSSLGPNCTALLGYGSSEERRADSSLLPLQKPSKHKKKKHKKDKEERLKDKRKSKKKVPPTDEEAAEPVENGTLDEEPLPVRVLLTQPVLGTTGVKTCLVWDMGSPCLLFSCS